MIEKELMNLVGSQDAISVTMRFIASPLRLMDLFGDKTLYTTDRDAILLIITIGYKLFAPAKVE